MVTTEDEEARVHIWRVEQLIRLGVPETEAVCLSLNGVADWHLLDNLLMDGCPLELALEITR